MHKSTKSYGHERGLSCAYRQWRADSHCRLLHGYALAFKFVFEAKELDRRNWVVDFGGLRALEKALKEQFDHTVVIANDDPELKQFQNLHSIGVIDLKVIPKVGCEMFARYAFEVAKHIIKEEYGDRVRVVSCEVCEHGANSAIYEE